MKYKIIIAFSAEAADYAENNSIAKMKKNKKFKKGYDWDIKSFKTKPEMNAYLKGINDGNGWDQPYWE